MVDVEKRPSGKHNLQQLISALCIPTAEVPSHRDGFVAITGPKESELVQEVDELTLWEAVGMLNVTVLQSILVVQDEVPQWGFDILASQTAFRPLGRRRRQRADQIGREDRTKEFDL